MKSLIATHPLPNPSFLVPPFTYLNKNNPLPPSLSSDLHIIAYSLCLPFPTPIYKKLYYFLTEVAKIRIKVTLFSTTRIPFSEAYPAGNRYSLMSSKQINQEPFYANLHQNTYLNPCTPPALSQVLLTTLSFGYGTVTTSLQTLLHSSLRPFSSCKLIQKHSPWFVLPPNWVSATLATQLGSIIKSVSNLATQLGSIIKSVWSSQLRVGRIERVRCGQNWQTFDGILNFLISTLKIWLAQGEDGIQTLSVTAQNDLQN